MSVSPDTARWERLWRWVFDCATRAEASVPVGENDGDPELRVRHDFAVDPELDALYAEGHDWKALS